MKIRILLIAILTILSSTANQLHAVIIAQDDNFFVEPGNTSWVTFNILANDYYADDGTIDDMEVTITQGTKGFAMWDNTNKALSYRLLNANNIGTDVITYKIKSLLTLAEATGTIYIHINDKPDNISDATCFVDPTGITFNIKELGRTDASQNRINEFSPIIVGDIDNDGITEIFVFEEDFANPQYNRTVAIIAYVMNPVTNQLSVKYRIPFDFTTYPFGCIAIAKITGGNTNIKETPSLFLVNPSTRVLYRYDIYDTGGGVLDFEETWHVSYTENILYRVATPFITDIMGDGRQQVVMGDKIFDADSGTLLATATDDFNNNLIPASGTSTHSFGRYGHEPYEISPVVADIDNDGIMEIIGGDCVYKINITDYSSTPTGNTYKLFKRADNTLQTQIGDGGTAVADFDGDGYLDVVVSGPINNIFSSGSAFGTVYIYNPRTGELLHDNSIANLQKGDRPHEGRTQFGPSRPFVGDMDGDGVPEFAVTYYRELAAFKLDKDARFLETIWVLPTTDASAATTLSMFDFAQDGNAKLVYRDITTLRIIDGRKYGDDGITEIQAGDPWNNDPNAGTRVLATFEGVNSATVNEYAIVADVNGDGTAEILAVGTDTPNARTTSSLRVYGPAGTEKWAPARSVWNQIAYNPVFVNDDLTIPANPINPATTFYETLPDGTIKRNRPFNNFLQQSTTISIEGRMSVEGADITISSRFPRRIKFNDNGSVDITVTVENIGAMTFDAPIEIQLFRSEGGAYTAVGSPNIDSNASGLLKDDYRTYTFNIPSVAAQTSNTKWALTVNLTTEPEASIPLIKNGKECQVLNNRAFGLSMVSAYTVACEGETNVVVTAEPASTFDITWYTLGGTILSVASDTYTLPVKDADPITKLLMRAYKDGVLLSNIPDTAYIYHSADSLVWNNSAGTQDWHDFRNWTNPNPNSVADVIANIPRSCTNVLLPSGINGYPNLNTISGGKGTTYTAFTNAICNNISFDFGGGLERPDLLQYANAFVKVDFTAHRWYTFAPPLKNFYTGDLYTNTSIPVSDETKRYLKFWGETDPRWGGYFESAWTSMFPQPDIEFTPGKGMGVWISRNDDTEGVNTFKLPKYDSQYHVYYENTTTINPHFPAVNLNRSNNHRFIFDGTGANGTNFNLNVEAKQANSIVLVGNPFMAHLDFDKFYAANAGKIRPLYRVIDRMNNTYLHYVQGGPSELTKEIPPMQAFMVEAIVPFNNLTVNGTMTTTKSGTGSTLRSAKNVDSNQAITLPITVSQGEQTARSYISFSNDFSDSYDQQTDVLTLVSKASDMIDMGVGGIGVYSINNGTYLSLDTRKAENLTKDQFTIPIGIRTASKQPVRINIGNLSALTPKTKITLVDAKHDKSYDLSSQSMYTFSDIETTAAENYMANNRFVLKIGNAQTAIKEDQADGSEIKMFCKSNLISINSNKEIMEVSIFNMQGMLVKKTSVNETSYSHPLPYSPAFIVQVKTTDGTHTRKVINE